MKKDIKNVAVTFLLILVMLYGSTFFYTKKVTAEEALEARAILKQQEVERAEALFAEHLRTINEDQEKLLAAAASKAAADAAARKAAADAVLAKQKADAAAAQKLAQQQADAAAAAKAKASRKSRAS